MSPSLRWTVWYVLVVGALGMSPFFAVLLLDAGWTQTQVPWLLLAGPIGLLTTGPLVARTADTHGAGSLALRGVLLLTGLLAAGLLATHGHLVFAVVLLCFALVRAPTFPLADAAAVAQLGTGYGRARGIGSAAYLVVALGCSALRESHPEAPLWVGSVLLLAAFAWSFVLPPSAPAPKQRRPLLSVLTPALLALIAVSLLNGLTLGAYDNLFSLRVEVGNLPDWVTGTGIALGVSVEVFPLLSTERPLPRPYSLTGLPKAAMALILTPRLPSAPISVATPSSDMRYRDCLVTEVT